MPQYSVPYAQYPALANLRTAAATTAAKASSPLNLFTSAATGVTPPNLGFGHALGGNPLFGSAGSVGAAVWPDLPTPTVCGAQLANPSAVDHKAAAAAAAEEQKEDNAGTDADETDDFDDRQGLTLVLFSAQLKRFLWDRGCIQGVCRGCLGGLRGCSVSETALVELKSGRV